MKHQKICSLLIYTLLSSLGILTLLLVSSILFIQTPTGTNWLTKQLTSILKKQHIILNADTISGPLPRQLIIKNLTLADQQGIWFSVIEANIHINPWALLKGQLEIKSLTINNPKILRKPLTQQPAINTTTPFILPEIAFNVNPWWLNYISIQNLYLNNLQLASNIIGIPLELSIEGNGPTTNWNGQFQLISPELPSIIGQLQFLGNSSWIADNLTPSRELVLQVDSKPSNASPTNILEQPLHIHLSVYPEKNKLIIHSLLAKYGEWVLSTKKLELSTKQLNGNITLSKSEKTISQLPIKKALLSIDINGYLKKPTFAIQLDLPEIYINQQHIGIYTQLIMNLELLKHQFCCNTSGILTYIEPSLPDQTFLNNITLEAIATTNTITVKKASITGDLLTVLASGKIKPVTGYLTAHIKALFPTLRILAPLITTATLDGQCTINTELNRQNTSEPIQGTTTIALENMNWGISSLQNFLGNTVECSNTFTLTPTPHFILSLNTLSLSSEHIHSKGFIHIGNQQVDSTIDVTVNDLSGIHPLLKGDVQSSFTVNGSIQKPFIHIKTSSPKLTFKSLQINNAEVLLTTQTQSSMYTGDITLSAESTSAGDLHCSTHWSILHDTLQLKNILGKILGIHLTGDIEIKKPENLVNGNLIATVHSWKGIEQITDIPLAGKSTMTVSFDSHNNQSLSASWNMENLFIDDDISCKKIGGGLTIQQARSTPNLKLSMQLGTGTYQDFQWTKGSIQLHGPLDQLITTMDMTGATSAKLDLQANLLQKNIEIKTCSIKNLPKNIGLQLTHPTTITFLPQHITVKNLSLSFFPSGTLITTMYISPQKLQIDMDLHNLSLLTFQPLMISPLHGIIDGNLKLSGTLTHPKGKGILNIIDINYSGTNAESMNIKAIGILTDTPDPTLKINATVSEKDLRIPATIDVILPLDITANNIPMISKEKSFSGVLKWEGELDTLWKFVPLADQQISGKGALQSTFSGTIEKPKYTIIVSTNDAIYQNLATGLYFEKINTNLTLFSDKRSHLRIHATDGNKGHIEISGTIGPSIENFPLSIKGILTNLQPLHRKDLDITLSGTTNITGTAQQANISGEITIHQGELQLIGSPGSEIPTLTIVEQNHTMTTPTHNYLQNLSIDIHIPNRFFVRNNNIESEWSGLLHITQKNATPIITGDLTSIRGSVSLLGKQFSLTKSTIAFTGSTPPNPLLDISLVYTSPSLTATGNISGTATKPKFTLSSSPSLPQDEIVSQVLFGKNAQNLSRIQTIQLAQELANLTGFSSNSSNLLGNIRKKVGVDVLNIGSTSKKKTKSTVNEEQEEVPVLEIGKYLTNSIYLGLEQSCLDSSDTGARVEIELAPSFNLEGRTTTQTDEIGINWKKDY